MTLTGTCSACGAPCHDDQEQCGICIGLTVVTGELSASVRVRALTCDSCGAPVVGAAAGDETPCACCGHAVVIGPLRLERLSLPRPDEALSDGAGPDDQRRLAWLRSQASSAEPSPYDVSVLPTGCERLAELDPDDTRAPYELYTAFREVRSSLQVKERGRKGGAYRRPGQAEPGTRELERKAWWIAHQALGVFAQRQQWLQARPLIEQTFELASDAGWRQLCLIDLASMAAARGDLDAAEQWLDRCDPEPWWLEPDSSYRAQRGALAARQQRWEQVLRVVGEPADRVPVAAAHRTDIPLLRVAALESLERTDDSDGQFAELVKTHEVSDIEAALEQGEWLARARRPLARLRTKWQQQAWEKRQKALRTGLLFALGGLVVIPLAVVIFYGSALKTLICERQVTQPGVDELSCRIVETVIGRRIDERPLVGLQEAQIKTRRGEDSTTYVLLVVSTQGIERFGSCGNCQSEMQRLKEQIDHFPRDMTQSSLRIEEPGSDSGGYIALLLGLAGVGLALFGIGRIVRSYGSGESGSRPAT
jgi:hypothetical protein